MVSVVVFAVRVSWTRDKESEREVNNIFWKKTKLRTIAGKKLAKYSSTGKVGPARQVSASRLGAKQPLQHYKKRIK